MTKEENLVKQLFIGKVSAILGFDKTLELLKEAKEISKKYKHNIVRNNIVGQSEQLVICKKCGSSEMYQYTKTKDKCEDCGNIQDY